VSLVWDVLYLFGLVLGFPVLLYRMMTQRKYRSGILERLGGVPRRTGARECFWVHGVSVGEVLASRTLITGFHERHPDWDVVVSTTTDTGYQAARRTFSDCLVIRYPLDFSLLVSRSLSRIRPSLIVLMELELWPNFVRIASGRGVPVVIANGRLSERSYRMQRTFRLLPAASYGHVRRICAQTDSYARRFEDLGVPSDRIVVTGSLKYDAVAPGGKGPADLRGDLGLADDEKLLVAGSTAPGEEEILLDVYARVKEEFPRLRLAIVPRHPERFEEVASIIGRRGFEVLRRSDGGAKDAGSDAVILGETMGELLRFYASASVVFVGKSLIAPGGGQSIIEPASLGKPVVFGRHVSNFRETRDLLLAREAAVEVADAEGLRGALERLLADETLAADMGRRARRAVEEARGATQLTLDVIEDILAPRAKSV